jgi:hypothetical protein
MFERKIICRIYGPVMENNIWRITYNEVINALLKEDIIKSQRLIWLGHIKRMEDNDKREIIFQKKKRMTQDEMTRQCSE